MSRIALCAAIAKTKKRPGKLFSVTKKSCKSPCVLTAGESQRLDICEAPKLVASLASSVHFKTEM